MSATKQDETKNETTPRKRRGRWQDVEPLPPALALEMLQSAARECQLAGLPLLVTNQDTGLLLFVKGAAQEDTTEGARFILSPELSKAASV